MYNTQIAATQPKYAKHHALEHISAREREVLQLISYEYTTKEIATTLFLSTHTIDSHKKNLKLKLDVKNTAGLVRRGFELGILQIINAA